MKPGRKAEGAVSVVFNFDLENEGAYIIHLDKLSNLGTIDIIVNSGILLVHDWLA